MSALLGAALLLGAVQAKAVDYVPAPPLSQVVKTPVQACGQFRELPVPMIAWGGDMATIYANGNADKTVQGSLFAKEGISARLYREDRFVTQVEDYLSCKTPFLRGTLGMVAMASDVLNADPRTAPVAIYQETWSEGGDVLVVRDYIKSPKDLCGKTVAMQAYGPHVDLLTTVLKDTGCPGQVTIKWVRDITEVTKDKNSTYPAKVFREDKSIDAVFVISPDVDGLTKGKGEGVVKGAWPMFSTKTPNRVIADLYFVRKDFYDANQQTVQNFVHGLMLAQEASAQLLAEKDKRKDESNKWLKASASMLLDAPDDVDPAAGMYSDARFVGWKGNVSFFADDNYPRNFAKLTAEVGLAFGPAGLKLVSKPVQFVPAVLDYAKLSVGITDKEGVEASRFNKQAVEQLIRQRQQTNSVDEGRLFSFPVYFKANENTFPVDLYRTEFDKTIDLVSTYGGALLTIEGNADTMLYLQRKSAAAKCQQLSGPAIDQCLAKAGATPEVLARMKQGAKNLTLTRANALRDSVIAYAKTKNISLDPNQFATVGNGFMKPNVTGCKYDKDSDIDFNCYPQSKDQFDKMKRAEISITSVEAEADVFQPLDLPVAKK